MQPDQLAERIAAIYSAAWWVRHYCRPIHSQREKRAQALQRLGLTVRAAFEGSEDFEPILYAVCQSLCETPDLRFAVKDQSSP